MRLDAELVDAIVSALEQRLPQPAPAPPPAPVAPAPLPAPAELPLPEGLANGSATELLAHVDGTIATWNALRGSLAGVADELEETKKLLREAKEALSVSHAENDQHQRRVRALETEVAESRALVVETRARLQDAADALDSGVARIETPADY